MAVRPAAGMGGIVGSTRPTNDSVTLVPLPPKMGVTPVDSCRLNWRATLFFSTSAKGLRYLPTLKGTKSISHDKI